MLCEVNVLIIKLFFWFNGIGIYLGYFILSPTKGKMKTKKTTVLLGLILLLGSCVSTGKFTSVSEENQKLKLKMSELEEEVARLENLVYFLETEVKNAAENLDNR